MKETINKCLLSGDKSMAEMYLKQLGFIYSTCGPFTKKTMQEYKDLKKQKIQNIFTEMT